MPTGSSPILRRFGNDFAPFWNRERLILDLDLPPCAVPRVHTTAGQKFVASLQSSEPMDKVRQTCFHPPATLQKSLCNFHVREAHLPNLATRIWILPRQTFETPLHELLKTNTLTLSLSLRFSDTYQRSRLTETSFPLGDIIISRGPRP